MTRVLRSALKFLAHSNGLISPEPFAHIDHAALAVTIAFLELLTLGRHCVEEWRAQAVGGLVALDHHTIGFLETLRECFADVLAGAGHFNDLILQPSLRA